MCNITLLYKLPSYIIRPIGAHPALVANNLLAKLYETNFLSDVKFWQMDQVFASAILATFLLCMHITGHACIFGLNIDSKLEFSMSGFVQNLTFC